MRVLEGLKPEGVWKYFEELSRIPRGSHNEKAVSDYCVNFAKEHGLQVYQDDSWNVIMIKEASEGYEDAEPIIMQGHLDMVCEKKPDCEIDFEKDGLRLAVDGDYVYAEGTTLGGDDGIAVAYTLAVLDDDRIAHPRLEAVFTTCEEVGMDGAMALDVSPLKGHTVLNLDSEEEGILLTGCAGGCTAAVKLPVKRISGKGVKALLKVDGLTGGHSGAEIDKGRGNANQLLARVLGSLSAELTWQMIDMAGGLKDNAIPRESHAELLLPADKVKEAERICAACNEELKKEYSTTDRGVTVSLEIQGESGEKVLDEVSGRNLLALILSLPNGIQTVSADIEGLVETSLNLGILKLAGEELTLSYAVRSSVGTAREALIRKMQIIAEHFGAQLQLSGRYPAWEYRKDSMLREKMTAIYREMFGTEPRVEAIHAGLECGILASKIPDLDCVSMGPDILDIHTTEEKMSISSVERMWNYILEILKRK